MEAQGDDSMAERWKKLENNRQCEIAVQRGRHATKGRKYFGRVTDAAHQGHVGTRHIAGQTFEEFCEAQRILIEHRLHHETDEVRERRAENWIDGLIVRDLDLELRGRC